MKLTEIVKKTIKISLLGVALNQGILVSGSYINGHIFKLLGKGIVVDEKIVKQYDSLPTDLTALNYLTLANSLVHFKSEDHQKSESEKNCVDYSLATYDLYFKLLELNGRKDLEKKVRLATGWVGQSGIGHMFIEFQDADGAFLPYETNYQFFFSFFRAA